LRAIHTLKTSKNYTRLLGGLLPIHSTHWCGAQGHMLGARGPFLLAMAMVVAVVMPIVFVLRLLKNSIKTLKIFFSKKLLYLLLYTVKHIKCHVTLIVVWSKPEPL
jgi:hypothetical protein